MHSHCSLLFLTLGFSSLLNAFTRHTEDISPFDTALAETGLVNISAVQLTPDEVLNSYWTIFFLHLENGHDIFAVGQTQYDIEQNTSHATSRSSVLDITTGTYASTSQTLTGLIDVPATSVNISLPEYQTYFDPVDHLSYMVSTSTAAGIEYNLTSVPKGNMLYDGGSSFFLWGTNITCEFAQPECWVTGTVKINGTDVAVVPEKSMSWFDRQFGPGYGDYSWNLWIGYLSNGVKFCIWHNNDGPGFVGQKFGTFAFPNGHQEVYPMREDIKASNPFTSNLTNVTYHGNYEVSFPKKNITLAVTLPVLAGEIVNRASPGSGEALFEGYSTFVGSFGGEQVTGWGVTEQGAARS